MAKKTPFFSIVIANYNFGHLLPFAIESILSQEDDDYEIIIVDGGSTDNSVEVIQKYEKSISWWVSEPDHGQSAAFNKGFSHAQGRYFTWLNADDLLLPGTIRAVKKTLLRHPEASWATGNMVRFLHTNGKIVQTPWGPHYLPRWLQGKGRLTIIFGPSTFWSRESYEKVGLINEEMHYAMDVEYWTRLNHGGFIQVRVNHYCWAFRMHEESKTAEFGTHRKSEIAARKTAGEKDFIAKTYNYCPSNYWRVLSVLMRCLDFSLCVALLNRIFVKGKTIKDYFHLTYPYN